MIDITNIRINKPEHYSAHGTVPYPAALVTTANFEDFKKWVNYNDRSIYESIGYWVALVEKYGPEGIGRAINEMIFTFPIKEPVNKIGQNLYMATITYLAWNN